MDLQRQNLKLNTRVSPPVDNVDDDEETYSQCKSHPKKSQSKATVTSIDSLDDLDSVQITSTKKKAKQGQGSDTEIEEMDIEKKLLRKNLVSYQTAF